MRINNNMMAMNTHRQLGAANAGGAKSMEKLSSGMRINRAGDDAAGLAISEKMRGQIRGLNQAAANSQDGISMIQTAEGALNETHAILQRMRELSVQSANDTNVGVDRNEIQKEMNQLTSEINRIGNTTEFNTQKILKGAEESIETRPALELGATGLVTDGNLENGLTNDPVNASLDVKMTAGVAGQNGKDMTFNFGGEEFVVSFVTADGGAESVAAVTANSATINASHTTNATSADDMAGLLKTALEGMIAENKNLADTDFEITLSDTDTVTIAAKDGGDYSKGAGSVVATAEDAALWDGIETVKSDYGKNTTYDYATKNVAFSTIANVSDAEKLAGQGMTINGKTIEFYNADDESYSGDADFGVNISSVIGAGSNWNQELVSQIATQIGDKIDGVSLAVDGTTASELVITATEGGEAGNSISFADGVDVAAKTSADTFTAKFQVGANSGQSMQIDISDMRSLAIGISGNEAGATIAAKNGVEASFVATKNVSNGTDSTGTEFALDVSSHDKAQAATSVINDAIEKVSAQRSELGSYQNRLEHTIKNLDTSAENLQASEARIRDVDMAKEMMEQTKQNILAQASTAMLAQANASPEAVLQLLR